MKRTISIASCIGVATTGLAILYAQQKETKLRKVYDDQIAVLQKWQEPDHEQEYLLSGSKLGLSAGITFSANMPTAARISLGSGKSLTIHSAGDRFVASLFQAEKDGEITILYDLDIDGSWDARTSRFGKCAVFFHGEWHQVSKIDGLLSGVPHAVVDGVQYEFSAGAWKPSAEKGNSK